jgi:hypothetical protein
LIMRDFGCRVGKVKGHDGVDISFLRHRWIVFLAFFAPAFS